MAFLTISFFSFLSFLFCFSDLTESGSVGVNYGRVANNLPPAQKVVELLQSNGINQVKLFDADHSVLLALAGTNISVIITLPNELLASASSRPSFADDWVQKNVAAHFPATQIHAVAVGNEVFADPRNLTSTLVPAMQNIHAALARHNLDAPVKVSSPIALSSLQSSYPPSSGTFRPDLVGPVMRPMLDILLQSGSYLMVNAYPFFAYEANADVISLDYAVFRPNPGTVDPTNGLRYYSLLDAQLDAVFAAVSAVGQYDDLKLVVSETGWPSKGDSGETGAGEDNAAAYNGNLVRRVLSGSFGTPLRPQADIDVYLFALFNENQKPGPASERNYGLFYPNEEEVYKIGFRRNVTSRGQEAKTKRAVSPAAGGSGTTWCVAKRGVGKKRLQAALDYACGEGGADCRKIQPGAACYDPNTVEAHASFAFNSYYQKKGRVVGTCDFDGSASVVSHPPEFGKCNFAVGNPIGN